MKELGETFDKLIRRLLKLDVLPTEVSEHVYMLPIPEELKNKINYLENELIKQDKIIRRMLELVTENDRE